MSNLISLSLILFLFVFGCNSNGYIGSLDLKLRGVSSVRATNLINNKTRVITDKVLIEYLIRKIKKNKREVVKFKPTYEIKFFYTNDSMTLLCIDNYIKYNGCTYKLDYPIALTEIFNL